MPSLIPHSRPTLGEDEARAAGEAIRSGEAASGRRVAEFEARMAAYLGREAAVAVSSGTAALHLALVSMGVGPGDAVAVPSYNCAALAQAVRQAGAEIRLFDVDPATGNPTPETAAAAIEGARAIIVAHLFGACADAPGIGALGVPVVEDLAQGLGARRAEGMAGQFGERAVCSFYATKLMTSGGEGGMVLGEGGGGMDRVRDARSYDGHDDLAPRWNYKLTEAQAAVGLVQLSRYDRFIARRREIARRYGERLAGASIDLPADPPGGVHVYHRYVVSLPGEWLDRYGPEAPARAEAELEARGVSARRPIHKPLHTLMGETGFPGADAAWGRHLSLPIYPSMTDDEADTVADAVLALFG